MTSIYLSLSSQLLKLPISLYKTTKYWYYFHKLLFTLFLIIINNNKNNNIRWQKLLNTLKNDVQNAGCIVIKLVQWLHTRNDIFEIKKITNTDTNTYTNILEIFNDIYEHCDIHDIEYTNRVFQEDFGEKFTDIIELDTEYNIRSGSVAQVYKGRFNQLSLSSSSLQKIITTKNQNRDIAIKVVHPDLKYQMVFPYFYYCIYHFLSILKITQLSPFNIFTFFGNYKQQIDMLEEASNMQYFYDEYKNNPLIVIPEPILWSKNVLVMTYHEGQTINEMEEELSIYDKNTVLTYMNLFIKSSMFKEPLYHGDLHNGNWKIVKNTNTKNEINPPPYKIIIYDFGYCINNPEQNRLDIFNLFMYLDLNRQQEFASKLYDYIEKSPKPITRQEFIDKCFTIMKNNRACLFSNNVFKLLIKHLLKEQYVLSSNLLDLLISILLMEKLLKKYLYFPDLDNEEIEFTTIYNIRHYNNLIKILQNYKYVCETYDCFHKLQNHFRDYIAIIENVLDKNIDDDFKKYKDYRNNRKRHLDTKNKTKNILKNRIDEDVLIYEEELIEI